MTRRTSHGSRRRFVGLAALLLLAGCEISALGKQPPTRVYVLATLEDQGVAPRAPERDVTIGVGTAGFPPHLERKEVVTRESDNRLVIHQFDKWGTTPEEDFTRAMAANLRVLVPTRRAVVPPFRTAFPIDYEIRVSVDRFERLADGTVALDARWVVVQQPEGRPLANPQTQIRVPDVGTDIPAVVAAMSEALVKLSEQAAASLPPAAHRSSVSSR